jgi:hypothetical protein
MTSPNQIPTTTSPEATPDEELTTVTSPGLEHHQAHPLAKSLYDLLKGAPVADRRHVLMAARGLLTKRQPEAVELCLNAMRAALGSEGRLSRAAYDHWRGEQEHPAEFPSSQLIANTFGSWAKAKEAAGETSLADVLARRLLENGSAVSGEELLASIALYADTGNPLTQERYAAWARDQVHRQDRRLDRYPRSAATINRLFGSWTRFLIAAGLGDRLSRERPSGFEPSGTPEDYSLERIEYWLRAATPHCGGRLMTVARYDDWARRMTTEGLREGRAQIVPRSTAVLHRLPSWPHALAAAGLITEEEADERRGQAGRFKSSAFLTEALADALLELGPSPTTAVYMQWRRAKRISGAATDVQIPDVGTIYRRFGGWEKALVEARALNRSRNRATAGTGAAAAGKQNRWR